MEVWHKCQVAWGLQASKVTGLRKSLRSRLGLVQMVIRPQRQEPRSWGLLQVALALPRAGCYPEEMLGFYSVCKLHASSALSNGTWPGFFSKCRRVVEMPPRFRQSVAPESLWPLGFP